MLSKTLVTFFSTLLLIPAAACAHIHGGPGGVTPPPPGCAYSTYLTDGCAAANKNANFQIADLYTFSAQSGQTWSSHHPQTWNVAGVDYPVGYDKTLTLKVPGVDALPAGCVYSASGNPWLGPQVLCDKAVNPTLNGWDFATNCVYLNINRIYVSGTTPGGTITITNNKFKACGTLVQSTGAVLRVTAGAQFNAVFSNNEVDGNAAAFIAAGKDVPGIITWNQNGNLTEFYNYFHDIASLPQTGVLSNGEIVTAYNFVANFGVNATSGHHGAYFEILNAAGSNSGSIQHSYNVAIMPFGSHGATSVFTFLSPHTPTPWFGVSYTKVQLDHNTTVINKTKNTGSITDQAASAHAISWVGYLRSVVNWIEQDNWTDPTGALDCLANNGGGYFAPLVYPDNNTYTGAGIIGDGHGGAGNTLTVTALPNGNIYPSTNTATATGSMMFHDIGLPSDVLIEPYGSVCDGNPATASANNAPKYDGTITVTYCLDHTKGPFGPITLTPATAQTQNTPVTNLTFGGSGHENKSVLDGGATPITISGTQWNAGQCPGAL